MLEHHTNTLIDWKHWTRSSDLLIDAGSSFHSVSRQFNDRSLLNASVAPGIGTRRLVLVSSAYIPFLQIECWFSSAENESLHMWVIFHIHDREDGRGRVSWDVIESCCIMVPDSCSNVIMFSNLAASFLHRNSNRLIKITLWYR